MNIRLSLNKRLYTIFVKNFKNDLVYYNKSGVINYIINNFPLINKNINQIVEDDLYLEDFENNLQKYKDRVNFNIIMKNDDTFNYKRIKNKISELYDELYELKFNRSLDNLAINYMIFHILANNGFIELKEKENFNMSSLYEYEKGINELEQYFDDEEKIYLE